MHFIEKDEKDAIQNAVEWSESKYVKQIRKPQRVDKQINGIIFYEHLAHKYTYTYIYVYITTHICIHTYTDIYISMYIYTFIVRVSLSGTNVVFVL